MTATAPQAIEGNISPVAAPGRVGQATAIEQSRAVAEVQAAVIAARSCPRDMNLARQQMQDSCDQLSLAENAFYRYPKAGQTINGPSVHLARELARCFGNVQYGIDELRRDDDHGQSEMLAWAWDVQNNTRPSMKFVVPHRIDKSGGPKELVEMRDIYENNTNMGARRLREQIFAIIPKYFTEEAVARCEATLARGDGRPLDERIAAAVDLFGQMEIGETRLEQKLGRPRERWDQFDLAQLRQSHRAIQRGEAEVEDVFPQRSISVAEITAALAPAAQPAPVAVAEAPVEPEPDAPAEAPAEDQAAAPAGGVPVDELVALAKKAGLIAQNAKATTAAKALLPIGNDAGAGEYGDAETLAVMAGEQVAAWLQAKIDEGGAK